MILVSVVTLVYNHAPYLRQCLDGFIMQQCNFEFEVLINDDASTDGSAEIIREYEEKYPDIIKPIYQTENQYSKGGRVNVRFNFPRAKGKYIAMCEGDDFWTDPLKLQKQVDFLEQAPDFVLSFHNTGTVDEHGKILLESRLNYDSDRDFEPAYINMIHIPTLSMVFRNHCIDPEKFPKVFNGDIFLVGLLSKFGKARYQHFNGANYRKHAGGVYSSSHSLKRHKDSLKSRELLLTFLPSDLQLSVRRRMNNFYSNLLNELLAQKKIKEFVKYQWQFLQNCRKQMNLKPWTDYQKTLIRRIF